MLKIGQLVQVFSGCECDGLIGMISTRQSIDTGGTAYRVNFNIAGITNCQPFNPFSWFSDYELGSFEPVQT